jgi:opacity protein-like surface antigen
MRNLFILVALVLFVAAPTMAQETPKAELFGGYEYLRISGGNNCHGGGGNLAYNFKDWLGGVVDLSGCKVTGLPAGASASAFNYLFGPRVSYRSYGSLTPFGQILFGGERLGAGLSGFGSGSANAFAMTIGGGADYKFTEHVSFRGQAEYLYTHFAGSGQNNARIEAGIVYRWGAR